MSNRSANIFTLIILAIAVASVIYAPKIFVDRSKVLSNKLNDPSPSYKLPNKLSDKKESKPLSPPQLKKITIRGISIPKVKANATPIKPIKIAESMDKSSESEERSLKDSSCQVTLSPKALQDPSIKNFLARYKCDAN